MPCAVQCVHLRHRFHADRGTTDRRRRAAALKLDECAGRSASSASILHDGAGTRSSTRLPTAVNSVVLNIKPLTLSWYVRLSHRASAEDCEEECVNLEHPRSPLPMKKSKVIGSRRHRDHNSQQAAKQPNCIVLHNHNTSWQPIFYLSDGLRAGSRTHQTRSRCR